MLKQVSNPFGIFLVSFLSTDSLNILWMSKDNWCCIIILDTSASRIYKKISGMEVVKWHRKKFMTRNLKFRL